MARLAAEQGDTGFFLIPLEAPAEAESSPHNQTLLNSFNRELTPLKIHVIVE